VARAGMATATRDPRELAKGWADDPGVSGSTCGEFTLALLNQLCTTIWSGPEADLRLLEVQQAAAMQALRGIAPRDPVEGMLAAQMVATHDAAMQCYRRASAADQTFAGRDMALRHAGKLARSYAALVEALDRHRGKGQPQVVRVERVTVEAGGQAIVGAVSQGGGDANGTEDRPHARAGAAAALAHAPAPALRGADPAGEPVPVAGGGGQTAVPDARRRGRERGARGQPQRPQARAL
jgi:hypothetical protein